MMNRKAWPCGHVLTILFFCVMGLSHELLAQQAGQPPPPASSQTQAKSANDPGAAQTQPAPAPGSTTSQAPAANPQSQPAATPQRPKDDRIFFALPNLLTVENASSLPPLTTRQKFKTVAEGCFDPVEIAFMGTEAGIDQADNANPSYRQGMLGYSKRFGTDYADAIIGNFGTGAIFPTLLRQDPRYYQMGTGSFLRRFTHAAGRVLITRGDSGKTQFNFSEFLGNGLAAGLSNAYHPAPHTLASSADVLGTQVLMDALGYELKEFWPDIHRFLKRGKHNNM
jgi:hypothetical protein